MCYHKLLKLFPVFLLVAFLGLNCSSDDNNPINSTDPPEHPAFTFNKITVPDQMIQTSDPHVVQALDYITHCQNFNARGCFFDPSPNAQKDVNTTNESTKWQYRWRHGALDFEMEIRSQRDRYTWTIYLDGEDGGVTYNNWKFMEAVQLKDQSSGHIYRYKTNTQEMRFEWTWNTMTNNAYRLNQRNFEEPLTVDQITSNADQSGEIYHYERANDAFYLAFKAIWHSDGSGSWWTYDENSMTDSGSW